MNFSERDIEIMDMSAQVVAMNIVKEGLEDEMKQIRLDLLEINELMDEIYQAQIQNESDRNTMDSLNSMFRHYQQVKQIGEFAIQEYEMRISMLDELMDVMRERMRD
jgi:hypothetical protein